MFIADFVKFHIPLRFISNGLSECSRTVARCSTTKLVEGVRVALFDDETVENRLLLKTHTTGN